jgi:peptide/nickel transport system ATP-binding protein
MYAGQLVESGSVDEVLDHPRHPYTRGLIASSPSRNARGVSLAQIAGSTPSPLAWPSGCRFRDRCPRATEICETPPDTDLEDGHRWRCFHPVFEEDGQ